MTDEKRELIDQSAYRLRNQLTFLMLCSDTLKLDLHDVLSREHKQEFQRMDRILQETKAALNTLLRQLDLEPRAIVTANGNGSQLIGCRVEPGNAA
jgi:hypothetical protein